MQAVEQDLRLDAQPGCGSGSAEPNGLYNVEEGLARAILTAMPDAQRVKYLRVCEYHDEEYWRQYWVQTLNTGRVLLKAARPWLRHEGH